MKDCYLDLLISIHILSLSRIFRQKTERKSKTIKKRRKKLSIFVLLGKRRVQMVHRNVVCCIYLHRKAARELLYSALMEKQREGNFSRKKVGKQSKTNFRLSVWKGPCSISLGPRFDMSPVSLLSFISIKITFCGY